MALQGVHWSSPNLRAKPWTCGTELMIKVYTDVALLTVTSNEPVCACKCWLDPLGWCRLVDSRDIVELEVKHKDYELLIRKKEALPTPPAPPQMSFPGPHVMAHTSFPTFAPPPPPPVTSLAASAPAPAAPSEVPTAPPAAEYPPMLSPMAGTFYRSPGPGESSFVKVSNDLFWPLCIWWSSHECYILCSNKCIQVDPSGTQKCQKFTWLLQSHNC